jgi:hypothetical protein
MAFCANALGGAQIVGGRLAGPAVRDDVEGNGLALVEGAHAGAFDRADMNEDVLIAILRLNEAKTFLAVEPLHGALVHGNVLSLTVHTVGTAARKAVAVVIPVFDFGEGSETCAPVIFKFEAKRPSRSAKDRWNLCTDLIRLLQGTAVAMVTAEARRD